VGFTIDTYEQARALVGKRVVITYDGETSPPGVVGGVDSRQNGAGFDLVIEGDLGVVWALPDHHVTFELAPAEEKPEETHRDRVVRLRGQAADLAAELEEAEAAAFAENAAAAAEGLPELPMGFSWSSDDWGPLVRQISTENTLECYSARGASGVNIKIGGREWSFPAAALLAFADMLRAREE